MNDATSAAKRLPRRMIRVGVVAMGLWALIAPAHAQSEQMSPGKYKAPMKYAVRLPDYCGAQYFDRPGPKYQLPPRELCGVRTNHFCPALVSLMQYQDERSRVKRLNRLKHAEKEILYTQRGIADFPKCPLHPEVEAALARTRAALQAFR